MVLRIANNVTFSLKEIYMCGDSMCSIMSMRKEGMQFKPFFQNRVAEILASLETVRNKVVTLHPLQNIDGTLNPADVCTRGVSTQADVGSD